MLVEGLQLEWVPQLLERFHLLFSQPRPIPHLHCILHAVPLTWPLARERLLRLLPLVEEELYNTTDK